MRGERDADREPEPALGPAPASTVAVRRSSALARGPPGRGRRRAAVAPAPAARRRRRAPRARVPVERGADPQRAVLRAAVADHVRGALAHRPRQHGLDGGIERTVGRARRSASIPAADERHPRALELAVERRLAVAADRVADLARAPGARRASTSAISRARLPRGAPGSSRPASSALSAITDRLWPSRSCRSRAKRSRSWATASSGQLGAGLEQLVVAQAQVAHQQHQQPDAGGCCATKPIAAPPLAAAQRREATPASAVHSDQTAEPRAPPAR